MHKIDEGHLITILYHESGEEVASTMKLPESFDPQKIGSAITYYRRYSICGLLSICADEDDDAQSASDSTKKQATVPRSQRPDPPPHKPASRPPEPTVQKEPTPKDICEAEVYDLMRQLKRTKKQNQDWAAAHDPRPKESWPLAVWESAREKLMHEVDDHVRERQETEDYEEDLAASGHTV
jgi:hypothetical protein